MPKSNKEDVRFGSMSESEVAVGSKTEPRPGSKFQLPTLGPIKNKPLITNPLLGYAYRDNETFPENFDKIEMLVDVLRFDLNGGQNIIGNGSTVPAASAIYDVINVFWPNVYTYLHEMAQKRDGYKATVDTLTSSLKVKERDALIIAMKINIRVLAQLYTITLVNEGTKSTLPGFRKQRSRILNDLEASNRLIYPSAWDVFIDYWSQVYSMYPGGPVIAHLFVMPDIKAGGTWAPATGAATVWAALPDLTSEANVEALLNDVEIAQSVLENYNVSDANNRTDLRLVNSIYNMMGFPTPQTALPKFMSDSERFYSQFMEYGFLFSDTKGAGADTHLFWPDIRSSLDTLINIDFRGYTPTLLDFMGAKGRMGYAYDADDDDTPGYTAEANDLTAYGTVCGNDGLSASFYDTVPPTKIYTREDGWITLARELDYTSAAGVQAHVWSVPDMLIHNEFWRAIMSEESEEAYLHNFRLDCNSKQVPFDHFGQTYRKWLYDAYKIPYIT